MERQGGQASDNGVQGTHDKTADENVDEDAEPEGDSGNKGGEKQVARDKNGQEHDEREETEMNEENEGEDRHLTETFSAPSEKDVSSTAKSSVSSKHYQSSDNSDPARLSPDQAESPSASEVAAHEKTTEETDRKKGLKFDAQVNVETEECATTLSATPQSVRPREETGTGTTVSSDKGNTRVTETPVGTQGDVHKKECTATPPTLPQPFSSKEEIGTVESSVKDVGTQVDVQEEECGRTLSATPQPVGPREELGTGTTESSDKGNTRITERSEEAGAYLSSQTSYLTAAFFRVRAGCATPVR
ncbi:hypothetical protein BaRGS_00040330 [Batillaria attramentaria]|uniref:Uncharacterized protein n=1 Tax=Batillaria attramentaria TaxID=370345 RepID=A0ABD0J0R1_9CAEN